MNTLMQTGDRPFLPPTSPPFAPLRPLRNLLNGIPVNHPRFAHLICRVIPCKCPFERTITLFNHSLHIPPLCKINPLYNEIVALRFRALNYLVDTCGEDINHYIC